ncbi:adenylosuccinate lyase [Candidatus Saccharibacteria bacterium]|nr:adenylosuccinate lyase [Candidatus Saccharibacteria bacterium]
MDTSTYHSPFDGRYTSAEMNHIFSDDRKFSTWRRLWIALAKAEQILGLDISDKQIAEMEQYAGDINYDVANAREKEVRHDVMAHVYAFGQQAKSAAGIIHLGATSCYVTDNTDILNIRDALQLVRSKLLGVIKLLADFAKKEKSTPTLGYTHYQPATPTTIGKRASLWLQNFADNLSELDFVISQLKMLGCRGATGSSETFMKLFHGDESKCKALEMIIAANFGFTVPDNGFQIFPVSGQTYPRNLDFQALNTLAAIAASAHKMALDIRLLQHDKEIEEPFAKNQIGSSAMAYKRNPMRSERICSLARFISGLPTMAWQTAATQMIERTLDDSAGRRIYIPDAFRATDAVLILCSNVIDGLVINRGVINARLDAELPFMATEAIIMKAVEKGADRQTMHARVREISLTLGKAVKDGTIPPDRVKNEMAFRINDDSLIPLTCDEVYELFDASKLIGRCPGQVDNYLSGIINVILASNQDIVVDTKVNV